MGKLLFWQWFVVLAVLRTNRSFLLVSATDRTCVLDDESPSPENGGQSCPSAPAEQHDLPVAYIKDSPLHTDLVEDTLRAINVYMLGAIFGNRDNGAKEKKPRYFEGWYYKLDLPDEQGTFVVIPGLYLRPEDPHGFVMVLDASQNETSALDQQKKSRPICRYYRFSTPIKQIVQHSRREGDYGFVFWLSPDAIFTAHDFTLNTKQAVEVSPTIPATVEAQASWGSPVPLTATTRWNPTIMGWFSWLPRGWMQCSHGVVSTDHMLTSGHAIITTAGALEVGNTGSEKRINFTGARGYIEKDWGREFPERYTWIQANDFHTTPSPSSTDPLVEPSSSQQSPLPGASFLVSVARIQVKPFEKWWEFQGFLSFLRFPDPHTGRFRTIRLATYTGAKASYSYNVTTEIDRGDKPRVHTVVVTLTSSKHQLTATVQGDRDNAATLWGPLPSNPSGGMQPYVREMLNCPVRVVLVDRKTGEILFDGTAQHGGFEIEGHPL